MREAARLLCAALFGAALLPGSVCAQGTAPDALPGLYRLGVAAPESPMVTGVASTGYAYTEEVLAMGDSHHRFAGTLAAAVRPIAPIAIGLSLAGRYDATSLPTGTDDAFTLTPRLNARAGFDVDGFRLGVDFELMVPPGDDGASLTFDATTVSLEGLLGYAFEDVVVAMTVGYRFDRTGRSLPPMVTPPDAVHAQVSDFGAFLLGAGASVHVSEAIELFGELLWEPWIGDGAPDLSGAPLRGAVGGRIAATGDGILSVFGVVEAHLAGRPDPPEVSRVPVVPRVAATLGLVLAFPAEKAGSTEEVDRPLEAEEPGEETEAEPEEEGEEGAEPEEGAGEGGEPTDAGAEPVPPDPEEPEVPLTQLRGLVRGFDGDPLVATVAIEALDLTLETDAEGEFDLEVEPGTYVVRISAAGHRPQQRRVRVDEGGVTVLNVELYRRR